MGHGIKIVLLEKDGCTIAKECGYLYLSYNWSDLKDIWSVHQGMHSKTVKDALTSLREADAKMESAKIKIAVPSGKPNWAYGCDAGPKGDGWNQKALPDEERKEIFRFHIQSFVADLAKMPAEAVCVSDSCSSVDDLYNRLKEKPAEQHEVKSQEDMPLPIYLVDSSGPYAPILDPIKGQMNVRTVEQAMYVAGRFFTAEDFDRALLWGNFAKLLQQRGTA